jgi:alkyl sulfatase BDS1-like metallo-beta-lactamase superfamily hydrolase
MINTTLTTIPGFRANDGDLTIALDRKELEDVMMGAAKLADKVVAGKAKLEGNPDVLLQLASTITTFDNWFEVLPGTRKMAEAAPKPELLRGDATLS